MKIKALKKFFNTPRGEKLIGNIAYYYLKFVYYTTRWKSVTGVKETYEMIQKHGSVIVIGWHGRTLGMPFFWNKSSRLNALVSPHHDGQVIVHTLRKFGIGHISGSSNENSTNAALGLMHNLQEGNSIAIIPDGPRGPSMTLSMSPLFYALKSGKPILGITYSISGAKVITKSWDNMLVPLPFHKGAYAITKPFFIPADATQEDLENYRRLIEKELNDLTWKLDQEMGIEYIPQGREAKKSRKQTADKKRKGM
ncbi:MAG: lysophospholipid acyltransferase family protein [Alphaproteobacteria bacterium]|nr:lysophospholipid acyltransferase family protein [Alphaproteobacteria bacterium]